MRVLNQLVEASSYPTAVSLSDYREELTGYEFLIQAPNESGSDGTSTIYSYSSEADIAIFHRCHPHDLTPMATPGSTNGTVFEQIFRLVPSSTYPSKDDLFDLVSVTRTGSAVATLAGGAIDTFVITPPTGDDVSILATEVASFELSVNNAKLGDANSNAIIQMRLVCKDPVDGKMRVIEQARANVNVPVLAPAAIP